MILITTAGKVGRESATLLAKADTPVRVLARDPTKVSGLRDAGVEIALGDLDDTSSIDAAMAGVNVIILVSPAVPAQELRVVDAAARARVGHVVKVTSKASPDSPIARRRGQSEIEAGLIASGLSYTLLRNNAYMQNFLALAPVIAATGALASSAANGRVGLVDARDVAGVAAQIAAHPEGHAGQTYWITGPQLLSYGDVANILSDVLGRAVTFSARTTEEDREAMIAAGVPAAIAEQNAQAFSLIATGDAEWLSDDAAKILGHPARSFEQFARDHAAAFTPATQSAHA
ncbi:MAG: NmrA family NAD(P)-binding protein [Trebonia sp.]